MFMVIVGGIHLRAKSHGSGSSSGSTTIRFDSGSNFPINFE
jgi:hypothetical protein